MDNSYFNWLIAQVCVGKYHDFDECYASALRLLYRTQFIALLPMDENRKKDSSYLRTLYSEIDPMMADWIHEDNASVLEVMITLAIRMEIEYMNDDEEIDNTPEWFWEFFCNLGLSDLMESAYNERLATNIINRFLQRRYSPDGIGNLFCIPYSLKDLRELDIWTQMMEYVNEKVKSDKGE